MTGMSARAPHSAPARPDASMSLLTNLIENSLDEGYAEAAAPPASRRIAALAPAGLDADRRAAGRRALLAHDRGAAGSRPRSVAGRGTRTP